MLQTENDKKKNPLCIPIYERNVIQENVKRKDIFKHCMHANDTIEKC